jgi:hypothetical protein
MGVSTVKLNGTTLMTVADTTATTAGVSNTDYFYTAAGVKTLGALDLASYATVADELIKVSFGSQSGTGSSVTWSKSNAKITADHELLGYALGTPNSVIGTLTWTTSAGAAQVQGAISGSTTLTCIFGKIGTTVT